MIELFWNLICFFLGITVGQNRAVGIDITKRTEYMQNLIDRAYAERDEAKHNLDLANLKLDMWEQRYYALLDKLESEEEDGLTGSRNRPS